MWRGESGVPEEQLADLVYNFWNDLHTAFAKRRFVKLREDQESDFSYVTPRLDNKPYPLESFLDA